MRTEIVVEASRTIVNDQHVEPSFYGNGPGVRIWNELHSQFLPLERAHALMLSYRQYAEMLQDSPEGSIEADQRDTSAAMAEAIDEVLSW